jgi:hypothetical protein
MFSSEALRYVWAAHKVCVPPRGRSLAEVMLDCGKFIDESSGWRKPDPMEPHFRRAAVEEYGEWAWNWFFEPDDRQAFCRRIRRNGPSLKKKHARYRRIWIAALALRLKE